MRPGSSSLYLNVVGADTRPYFREIYKRVGAWLPQAENIEVPDSNHCILQMNPGAAAQHLADFFARHPIQD